MLVERRSRIYEANRVSTDDEGRITDFFEAWKAFIDANNPQTDHVWNMDETDDFRSVCSVMLLSWSCGLCWVYFQKNLSCQSSGVARCLGCSFIVLSTLKGVGIRNGSFCL